MNLMYYLFKTPYKLTWYTVNLWRKEPQYYLYCEDVFDRILYRNVEPYLGQVKLVAKNKKVRDALRAQGFKAQRWPVFPNAVLMFRNSAWRFPCKKIVKIGFEHGAYNFKRPSKPGYYNMFTVFFMTSQADVKRAHARGVKTAKAIGFPKLDSAFNGTMTEESISLQKEQIGLDEQKKTILFSATWDGSGMSAVDKWYNKAGKLAARYNVLVTVHSWMSDAYRNVLKNDSRLFYIDDYEIIRFIKMADVCIGDTNSLIAEFCLLDKPVITFRVPPTPRTLTDVTKMIEEVSIRIDDFEELETALERAINNPQEFAQQRQNLVRQTLDVPDGKAGLRAATEIIKLVPQLKSDRWQQKEGELCQ